MTDSRYTVTLRLDHPQRDPGEVTTALNIDPDRCWSKGSARTGPHGNALGGFHKENAWMKTLAVELFDNRSLGKTLAMIVAKFEGREDYFRSFRDSGGAIRLETYWRIGSAWPEEKLDHSVLIRLGQAGIDLILTPLLAEEADDSDRS